MDKLLHFVAGAIIFWIASYFMVYPIIPVIVIAILKEIYDWKIKHSRMCFWDIVATILGGMVMYLLVVI